MEVASHLLPNNTQDLYLSIFQFVVSVLIVWMYATPTNSIHFKGCKSAWAVSSILNKFEENNPWIMNKP